jgi:hypothetical protein
MLNRVVPAAALALAVAASAAAQPPASGAPPSQQPSTAAQTPAPQPPDQTAVPTGDTVRAAGTVNAECGVSYVGRGAVLPGGKCCRRGSFRSARTA